MTPGPGWFAAVGGTLALIACVVVVLRAGWFRSRPSLRHDWPAAVATTAVVVAVALRVTAFRWATPWFAHNEPAIILALACLPLTLFALGPAQRILGLTAVTVFGPWVCAAHVYALVNDDIPVDALSSRLAIVTALISVAGCYAAMIPVRRTPTVADEGEPDAAPAVDVPAVAVLVLVVGAGALLILSRVFVFDAGNASDAAALGYPAVPWALSVLLPLVAVTQLVILRGSRARATTVAAGLLAGVALVEVEQVLSTSTRAADADSGVDVGGPGWWLLLLGTALLLAGVVVTLRARVLAGTPRQGAGGRMLLGLVLVAGALFAWLAAFHDFSLWWPANGPALLMAGVAVPVVILALSDAERLAALVAVTLFGLSMAFSTGYALLTNSFWSDVGVGVAVAFSALLSVLGCHVAQLRPPHRAPERSAADAGSRR